MNLDELVLRRKVNARRAVILADPARLARVVLQAEQDAYSEHADRLAVERAEQAERAERDRVSRCPRPEKLAWGTREGALDGVRTMRQKGRDPQGTLNAYPCRCGAWHVGNARLGEQ